MKQKYDFEIIIVIFKIRKPYFMETKFKITIPKPCHEDWNSMKQVETGRFCSVCTKRVVDFTKMGTDEIQEYFVQNREEKVCGRFRNEQVNRFNIQIPRSVLRQQMSFQKAFLLTLFIVMGTTLFSCKNHNDASLGEVSVVEDSTSKNNDELSGDTIVIPKDSIEDFHTQGISLPKKEKLKYNNKQLNIDSKNIKLGTNDNQLMGMTISKPILDSIKFDKK